MLNQLKSEQKTRKKQEKNKKKQKKDKKKIEKTSKKAIKDLIDFNKLIRDEVAEPGERRSFHFRVCNFKQEIIASYRRWRRKKESKKFNIKL